jgi:hypothetical protein
LLLCSHLGLRQSSDYPAIVACQGGVATVDEGSTHHRQTCTTPTPSASIAPPTPQQHNANIASIAAISVTTWPKRVFIIIPRTGFDAVGIGYFSTIAAAANIAEIRDC